MGCFSWLDCCSQEQIINDRREDVYLLVPKEFGGGAIIEKCYEGYGSFDGHDVYDLVMDWNKEYIPTYIEMLKVGMFYNNWNEHIDDMMEFHLGNPIQNEKRILGIDLACYDEDNMKLKYPIKITYNQYANYEDCLPSWGDPNQGWVY